MLRNKKGITLIALVVTIVVLLILAGVTISLLLDENGIIAKSKDARNANRAEAIKEEIKNETPLNKIGKPIDIYRCVKWLIEDEFTTGQIISPNGGYVI